MTPVIEYVLAAALVIGAVFVLVGSYGLVKLNNPMSRLHAPTKASTLGVGSILAASIIYDHAVIGDGSLNEILIMAFLFVTAPVSAHFIAKVAIHRGRIVQELPPSGEDSHWATKAQEPQRTES
jgi:multicomponent K+:H+ antiporter subunit G